MLQRARMDPTSVGDNNYVNMHANLRYLGWTRHQANPKGKGKGRKGGFQTDVIKQE